MAKPMLVTVPFVLILLDYWPLRRFERDSRSTLRRTLMEKLPLLGLAAGSAAMTILAQREAMAELGHLPLDIRLCNATVSYTEYLWQTFWPFDLAVFYPLHGTIPPAGRLVFSAAILVTLTGLAVAARRRKPALLVGWLWYLGMLVPVIGVVQVGQQSHADRYTYLPQIGLWLALAWGVPWLRLASRRAITVAALAIALYWAGLSAHQVSHWRDPETLWRHEIDCVEPDAFAHRCLGRALYSQERWEEASEHFAIALSLRDDALTHHLLATSLVRLRRDGEAAPHFRRAFELDPTMTSARTHLLTALIEEGTRQAREGHLAVALAHFDEALALEPNHQAARRNKATLYIQVGIAAARAGNPSDAVEAFREAVRADPGLGVAHNNLGMALMNTGEFSAAAEAFRRALRIDPGDARARANLERALAQPAP
jgi:Flp pilus assembly protein TadD